MSTTPGRLRIALLLLVVGTGVLWITALVLLREQSRVIAEVRGTDAALLAHAIELSTRLADVDATATRAFLEPGPGTVDVRARYTDGLDRAGVEVATIGALGGADPEVAAAVTVIDASLPTYGGLVEAGRADERQGLVVGAAYLRQASQLMRATILPAAADIYTRAAVALDDDTDRGTASVPLVVLAAATFVVTAALAAVQVHLALLVRRNLNVGLLIATAATLVIAASTGVALATSTRALDRAERDGSDAVQLLAAVRILTLRAHSDSNLALIERGTGQDFLDDAERIDAIVRGDGGLLAAAGQRTLPAYRASVDAITELYDGLVATTDDIVGLTERGSFDEAVEVALGEQAGVAADLDERLTATIDGHEARFTHHANLAGRWLAPVSIAVTLAAIAMAVAVVAGLRPRIKEYQ